MTSNSHVVEYRGRTGLSLPAGYHKQSVGLGVFQGDLKSRHRAYTIDRGRKLGSVEHLLSF
jgi:hypothetical protein